MIEAFVKDQEVLPSRYVTWASVNWRRIGRSPFHYAIYEAPEVRVAGTDPDRPSGPFVWRTACDAAVLDDLRAGATKALIDATRADILNSIKIDVMVDSTFPDLGIFE